MKLKEAIEIARWINVTQKRHTISPITYIAADADGGLWGHGLEPHSQPYESCWMSPMMPISFLGMYEGDEPWYKTCRKI